MPARVSLLASTYRSERFLPTWLESLERMSIWSECELIVVANDPQTEESRLLAAFAERHPQVQVRSVPREPLYRSWNRAIAAATAPILAIANVDDIRTPDGLAAQVEALEADPGLLFTYGDFDITPDFPPDRVVSQIRTEEFERERFTRGMMIGPFFAWRASDAPATRFFDEQFRVAADWDLAVRLALHGEGARVAPKLGFYYDGGTGLSTGGRAQPIERTVLELRYGIYDKLDLEYLPEAAAFVVPRMLMPDGSWLAVSEVVPDYDAFLADRRRRWWSPPGAVRRRLRGLTGR